VLKSEQAVIVSPSFEIMLLALNVQGSQELTTREKKRKVSYYLPPMFIYMCVNQPTLTFTFTSQLFVRYDDLQQYLCKLSTKKISRFFIDCLRSYNIFLIWLTDVIIYSIQYVLVQHG
jgi:hypothetical protein